MSSAAPPTAPAIGPSHRARRLIGGRRVRVRPWAVGPLAPDHAPLTPVLLQDPVGHLVGLLVGRAPRLLDQVAQPCPFLVVRVASRPWSWHRRLLGPSSPAVPAPTTRPRPGQPPAGPLSRGVRTTATGQAAVVQHPVADRAEQQAGQLAVAPAADHHQLRPAGRLGERGDRPGVHRLPVDRHVGVPFGEPGEGTRRARRPPRRAAGPRRTPGVGCRRGGRRPGGCRRARRAAGRRGRTPARRRSPPRRGRPPTPSTPTTTGPSGCSSPRATSTGQSACVATWIATEPTSRAVNPPRPRSPRTIIAAVGDSPSSTAEASPSMISPVTRIPGRTVRASATAASTRFSAWPRSPPPGGLPASRIDRHPQQRPDEAVDDPQRPVPPGRLRRGQPDGAQRRLRAVHAPPRPPRRSPSSPCHLRHPQPTCHPPSVSAAGLSATPKPQPVTRGPRGVGARFAPGSAARVRRIRGSTGWRGAGWGGPPYDACPVARIFRRDEPCRTRSQRCRVRCVRLRPTSWWRPSTRCPSGPPSPPSGVDVFLADYRISGLWPVLDPEPVRRRFARRPGRRATLFQQPAAGARSADDGGRCRVWVPLTVWGERLGVLPGRAGRAARTRRPSDRIADAGRRPGHRAAGRRPGDRPVPAGTPSGTAQHGRRDAVGPAARAQRHRRRVPAGRAAGAGVLGGRRPLRLVGRPATGSPSPSSTAPAPGWPPRCSPRSRSTPCATRGAPAAAWWSRPSWPRTRCSTSTGGSGTWRRCCWRWTPPPAGRGRWTPVRRACCGCAATSVEPDRPGAATAAGHVRRDPVHGAGVRRAARRSALRGQRRRVRRAPGWPGGLR